MTFSQWLGAICSQIHHFIDVMLNSAIETVDCERITYRKLKKDLTSRLQQ